MTKGCESCKWQQGHYCERPGGNDCDWERPLFGRGAASWIHWKPKTPRKVLPQDVTIDELRERRDLAAQDGDFALAFSVARAIDKKRGFK